MEVTHEIAIDLLKPRRNQIHVVQEDSTRKIRLTLLKDNLPYNVAADLPSGETLLSFVEFLKSDGHGGMYDTTSLGETAVALEDPLDAQNVWIVALDGQCFTAPGFAQINVRFETESGRRIHTFPIFVDVEATASSDTESTDWGELNSIADLRNAVGALFEATMSADAKQALLNLLDHVAYADEHGQDYYDELEAALFQTAEIVSISAVFEQGSATIYDTDDLDTLRQYLTVTATYEDLSEREITGYTLSGTLTEGTSTITVNYAGKTTTFDVTVETSLIISDILTLDGIKNTRNGHNASATTWEDLSGNNNDFSKYRTNVLWSENSAFFNGSNTGLSHSGVLFPTTLTEFTIELSIKIGAIGTSSSGYPVFCGDTSTFADREDLMAIIPSTTNEKTVQVAWGIGANIECGDEIAHVVAVFKDGVIAKYLNGQHIGTTTVQYSTNPLGRTSHFIGTRPWQSTSVQYFAGDIYRFGICSRALTSEEIASRCTALQSRFG